MTRKTCRACHSDALYKFLDLGSTPLADAFVTDLNAIEDSWPLAVAVCQSCWWVQLTEDVPDDKLFGSDYAFFMSSSPGSVEHHRKLADEILSDFKWYRRYGALEIGSNDGTLLKMLQEGGFQVLGVDPAVPPAKAANADGIRTICKPFSLEVAQEIAKTPGGPGLVIANNVFAHVVNPADFLYGIKRVLIEEGMAIIEFQYFPQLLFNNEFDNIYHEHRSFIAFTPFKQLAKDFGLEVVDVKEIDTQGGSLRVFLQHEGKGKIKDSVYDLITRESSLGLNNLDTYRGFKSRVGYIRYRLQDMIMKLKKEGKSIAGYGASAKSCTLLNSCGITSEMVDFIEDTTPYKIGKYTPGTHIPIVAPGAREKPDVYLVLIWNYLERILAREKGFTGQFVVPIPNVRLLEANSGLLGSP